MYCCHQTTFKIPDIYIKFKQYRSFHLWVSHKLSTLYSCYVHTVKWNHTQGSKLLYRKIKWKEESPMRYCSTRMGDWGGLSLEFRCQKYFGTWLYLNIYGRLSSLWLLFWILSVSWVFFNMFQKLDLLVSLAVKNETAPTHLEHEPLVQWPKLTLSKGPNWIQTFLLLQQMTETGPSFRNVVLKKPRQWPMMKILSHVHCNSQSSKRFRIISAQEYFVSLWHLSLCNVGSTTIKNGVLLSHVLWIISDLSSYIIVLVFSGQGFNFPYLSKFSSFQLLQSSFHARVHTQRRAEPL
jgi:hypothetical protein